MKTVEQELREEAEKYRFGRWAESDPRVMAALLDRAAREITHLRDMLQAQLAH